MIEILAPMPGTILKILAKVGDVVGEDSVVMIHEAMKMENSIFAACEGTVRKILVSAGESVEFDQLLLLVE